MTSSSDIDGRSGILVRGPAGAFRALGAFGRPAYESFAQLQSMLKGKSSPACRAYFARPTFDAEQKEFRWTAPATGVIRPWHELSNADRQAGEMALVSIGAELAGLREQLRGRGGQSVDYARLLDEAVKVPPHDGDDYHFLYLVGEQPVAAFWGFETHDGRWFDPTAPRTVPAAQPESAMPAAPAAAAAVPLTNVVNPPMDATPAAPPRPAGEPPKRVEPGVAPLRPAPLERDLTLLRRPWWAFWRGSAWGSTMGGILGLLLLGSLLLLLMRGCAVNPTAAPAAGMALDDRRGQSAPSPGAVPASPLNPVLPTPPQPGPAPAAPQAAQQATVPPATLPPSTSPPAAPDVRPLQGQWRAGEDLFDQNTGQPLDLTFAFGPDGNGKVTMRRPDGTTCSGAVTSRVNGARTTIEGAAIPCASGGSYAPPRVECTRATDGPLLCFGINPDGSRYRMAMRSTS